MSLNDLIQDKLNRLDSIPKDFVNKVNKEQKAIYELVLKKLDLLERKNGIITITQANLKIANEISNELVKVLSTGDYKTFVRDFIKEFDQQAVINDKIIKQTINDTFIKDKAELILAQYKKIATENLIQSSVLTSVLADPIKKEIEKAILNGSSIADLTENIRDITIGNPEQLGRLDRYANQIAYDAIATTDRAYTKTISEDNGIEFYRYAGGLVSESRDFCIKRDNKQYHINEIRDWGNIQNWEGRIKGTNTSNIFTNLGGWRCSHSLVPISLFRVKKDVLRRNIENGNITLNKDELELLGM